MPRLAAIALVVLLLSAGCLGLGEDLSEDATEARDGLQDGTALELTREALTEQRIEIQQPEPGWSSRRIVITPDMWAGHWDSDGGRAVVNMTVAIDADDDAEPVLGMAARIEPPADVDIDPVSFIQFAALDGGQPEAISASASTSCSGEACKDTPPRLEYAFFLGTMDGAANLSMGLRGDASVDAERILARERLTVGPDHTGEHVQAGTHIHVDTGGQDPEMSWTAGHIDVTESGGVEGPEGLQAARTQTVHATGDLPADGTLAATFTALDAIEVTPWSLNYTLPNAAGQHQGLAARVGPSTLGQTPIFLAQQLTPDGAVSIQLDRTATGKADPGLPAGTLPGAVDATLATWGWIDATLEELYGWQLSEQLAASGTQLPPAPPDGADALDIEASLELCPTSFEGLCLTDTLGGAHVTMPSALVR